MSHAQTALLSSFENAVALCTRIDLLTDVPAAHTGHKQLVQQCIRPFPVCVRRAVSDDFSLKGAFILPQEFMSE